jgi:hypothetical protein
VNRKKYIYLLYMETFQKIVLYAAIFVLILSLIMIGVVLGMTKDKQWPPMTPQCPDYWTIDGEGQNAVCVNVKDLGTCPPQSDQDHLTMNFNTPAFSGTRGLCAKYTWANKCGVSWDGITYGVSNPCQTNATNPPVYQP